MSRLSRLSLFCALAALPLAACESGVVPSAPSSPPASSDALAPPGDPAAHHAPAHVGALVERAWGGDVVWELVKPRPPGLGAPVDKAIGLYVIAPVNPADPLSPAIDVPGLLTVGGRDHVVPARTTGQGSFRGIARTVALQHPGWYGGPPFDAAACAAPVEDPRIAWAWVQVDGSTGHPCGQVAFVYAVQLDGEACPLPLTSEGRVQAALAQGLVNPFEPDEGGPWPFAIRPLGGGGSDVGAPPGCVPPGERS